MVVLRATLPPSVGKHVVAAIDTIVQQVAATPMVRSQFHVMNRTNLPI